MKKILFILLFLVGGPLAAHASDSVRVSRYLTVEPELDRSQLWPLEHVVDFNAAPYQSIGFAISYLLETIGYELHPELGAVAHILEKPVPSIHRQFDHLKVHQIIHALVGRPYQIVADPVTRQISFRLTEDGA